MGEIVLVGALWFLAFAAVVIFGTWRLEVNTRVLREVQEFMQQKQSARINGGEMNPEPLVAAARSAPVSESPCKARYARNNLALALPYVGFDDEPSLESTRQTSGETLMSVVPPARAIEPPPAIEVSEIPCEDGDEEFDHETLVIAAGMAGVWDGSEDEPMSERKTIEMRASEHRALGILRHADEEHQVA